MRISKKVIIGIIAALVLLSPLRFYVFFLLLLIGIVIARLTGDFTFLLVLMELFEFLQFYGRFFERLGRIIFFPLQLRWLLRLTFYNPFILVITVLLCLLLLLFLGIGSSEWKERKLREEF